MTTRTQPTVRHSLRPLNVFTFCGQPIPVPRDEYLRATQNLPPCPDCQQARNRVVRMLGTKPRLLSAAGATGSPNAS
jgi:hypothetical protein